MLSAEQLDHYRRMTPRERIAEFRLLMAVAQRALALLSPAERERRLAAYDAQHRASNAALLLGLAALLDDADPLHAR